MFFYIGSGEYEMNFYEVENQFQKGQVIKVNLGLQ